MKTTLGRFVVLSLLGLATLAKANATGPISVTAQTRCGVVMLKDVNNKPVFASTGEHYEAMLVDRKVMQPATEDSFFRGVGWLTKLKFTRVDGQTDPIVFTSLKVTVNAIANSKIGTSIVNEPVDSIPIVNLSNVGGEDIYGALQSWLFATPSLASPHPRPAAVGDYYTIGAAYSIEYRLAGSSQLETVTVTTASTLSIVDTISGFPVPYSIQEYHGPNTVSIVKDQAGKTYMQVTTSCPNESWMASGNCLQESSDLVQWKTAEYTSFSRDFANLNWKFKFLIPPANTAPAISPQPTQRFIRTGRP